MLCSLTISNLAVVQSLELEFDHGLTVLTGETGAGKSILLTALGLALGDRADSSYIRPGSRRAEINLAFDIGDAPAAEHWLKDNAMDDGSHCLIRRIITTDGRSKAFINNTPATLQSLQNLSRRLIEIHGQHAHLTLLKSHEQQRLLDDFGDHRALTDAVAARFAAWRKARQELDQQLRTSESDAAQQQLLRYQIEELEQTGVEVLDYEALSEEHTLHANLSTILSSGQAQLERLQENEHNSVDALLDETIHAFSALAPLMPELDEIRSMLSEVQMQVREAGQQLRRQLESLEPDPQRLAQLEEQLSSIHALARKHRIKPDQLRHFLHEQRQQLAAIEQRGDRIAELTASIEKVLSAYRSQAAALSTRRRQSARLLQQRVTELITTLGMSEGQFFVDVSEQQETEPRANGDDDIEFRVTTNPGMPPRSLAKVASGGELSRISLAIQVAATGSKRTPTMIFDEVDAGIGGGIAEIVGAQLRRLGSERQVLCVTHLPQVAAQAHHHLLVEKVRTGESTHSRVRTLTHHERPLEVARMLGGTTLTPNTLAHAEEMLSRAEES